jgi:hypothetical protein
LNGSVNGHKALGEGGIIEPGFDHPVIAHRVDEDRRLEDQPDVMWDPAHPEANDVANLDRIAGSYAFKLPMGFQPFQDLGAVPMLAAVHGVVRELTIIDGARFPVDRGDQLNAVDTGTGDAGMRNERRPEPTPRDLGQSRLVPVGPWGHIFIIDICVKRADAPWPWLVRYEFYGPEAGIM